MMSENSNKRVFKKYLDNRRLYDETGESYATLEDIVRSVREGEEVSVIATRGRSKKDQQVEDITQAMLVDALHKALVVHCTLTIEDLVNIIRGKHPTWKE